MLVVVSVLPFILESPRFDAWYLRRGKRYLIGAQIVLIVWLLAIIHSTLYNVTAPGADVALAAFIS